MQQQPKRNRKNSVLYLILGLAFGVVLVGAVSVIALSILNIPVTLESLLQLHLTFPLFLVLDFFILFSGSIFGWAGVQKDRLDDSRWQASLLTQNHEREIRQFHAAQAEQAEKHQAEIAQLNVQIDEQVERFQELEAIIRRGKQHWESTFDAVDDLIVLTDEAGAILRCNRATGEVLQTGYSQIIGRGIDELFSNGSESPQETIPGERTEITFPGSDHWYQVSKNHLLIDGRQEGWVYIFRNITAQKRALREQKRLTYYYELLVNNSPVAIVTLNSENRIIDCNPAFEKIFLYSKRESLGRKSDLLISPPDLIFETRGMAETVRNGETVHRVTQRRRKDGSLVDVEVFGVPVVLAGKQIGSLVLFHDVSELVSSQKGEPGQPEQAPGDAERILMTKFVEEAFLSQSTPDETGAVFPEMVEADLPQNEVADRGGEEQDPHLDQAEETGTVAASHPSRKRPTPIEKIEGIGPVYAQKLSEIGVLTTEDLLDQGRSRKGREVLVEKSGLSASQVVRWVNMADLMRVHGIGEEYSELLEKAGVDTVKELRNRNPNHLFETMKQVNETHKMVNRLPHLSEVESWIKEAKEMETVMTY